MRISYEEFDRMLETNPTKVLHLFIEQMGTIAEVDEEDMKLRGQVGWAESEIRFTRNLVDRFLTIRQVLGMSMRVHGDPKLEGIYSQLTTMMDCSQSMAAKWIEAMEEVKVTKAGNYVGQVLVAFSAMMAWDHDVSAKENYRRLTAVSIEWNESLSSGELASMMDEKLTTLIERSKAHPEDEVMAEIARKAYQAHTGAAKSIEMLTRLTEMMDIYLRAFRVLPEVADA